MPNLLKRKTFRPDIAIPDLNGRAKWVDEIADQIDTHSDKKAEKLYGLVKCALKAAEDGNLPEWNNFKRQL